MSLWLECLGGASLSQDGRLMQLSARKARILLGLLATARRRTMPRGRLAALLWETSDTEQAKVSLRQALAQIRRACGDGWVETEGDDLRLGVKVDTDVDAFQAALRRNDRSEAIRLYRGPFLDGLDAVGTDLGQAIGAERARLSGLTVDALVGELQRLGDSSEAATLAHHLLGLDPLNEIAHRCLMRAEASRGMRGAARARYEALEVALHRDLGSRPEPETCALHERIRRGKGGAQVVAEAPEQGGASHEAASQPAGYLLLALEADLAPDWQGLRERARAAGAVDEIPSAGELAFLLPGQELRHVASIALELVAFAGNSLSFGLTETAGTDPASVVQARRVAAMAEPGEVYVARSLAPRLGLAVDTLHRAVLLDPGAVRDRPVLPIFGREMELAQIEAAMAAARSQGSSLVVHLSGEAGIGKSRLAQEILRRCVLTGMVTVSVGFSAFSPGSRHLAQRILSALPRVPSPELGSSPVERAVWSWLVDPAIGNEDELRMSALDPGVQQKLIIKVLTSVLRSAGAGAGLLLVIEDCHWSPVGASDFILEFLGSLEEDGICVLMTERPHMASLDQQIPARARSGLVRMLLPPLSRAASRDLAQSIVPGWGATEQAIEHAAGHPLFLIRLIEANWTDGRLPATVSELVHEQVERLPASAREALRQGAILGASFDPADAMAIFPNSARPAPSGDLLHATQTGLSFGHDLIYRSIYESIPGAQRQEWHARAAAHFRGLDPIRWADHALNADDDVEAGRASAAAANAMIAGRRFSAALPFVEAGLQRECHAEDSAELHSCRAGIRRIRGDMTGALEDYCAAHAKATQPETRAAMLCRQALILHRMGQGEEAERALDAAEEIADAIGLTGLGRAEIHEQRGNRAFVRGDLDGCMRHHKAALAAAEATGELRGIARGHGGLGDAAYAAGLFYTAYRHFSQAIETAEQAGLGLVREEYLFMRAFSLFFADPGPQAHLLADIAVESAQQCGAVRAEMIAREVRAEMRLANGDLDGLEEDLTGIADLVSVRGETRFSKDVESLWAFLALRRGKIDEARRRVAQLVPNTAGDPYIGPTILGLAALVARDSAERDEMIEAGLTRIAKGALAHAVIWFHVTVMERAVRDCDQALARRHMDALERFASREPIGVASLLVRATELLLWPSTEEERREHAIILEDARLSDTAAILNPDR